MLWELEENSTFKATKESGQDAVLEQCKGLPIGGHLSAALVELVALWREYQQPWPLQLEGTVSARYRDNFFVALSTEVTPCYYKEVAVALSQLLAMPVKFERAGTEVRCLELRLRFDPPRAVHVTVAFRTDCDRQGEAGDVVSWPPRVDPRARMLVPALLCGLASKLRQYRAPCTLGYTASIRRAFQFVKAKRYPPRWWVRPFALALAREGTPIGCMPHLLSVALTPCSSAEHSVPCSNGLH